MESQDSQKPLRIGLLSYRGNPYCGGQGVYVRHLSHALGKLGHQVEVISGPPYPHLDNGTRLHRLPGLDLFNPDALFRMPRFAELRSPINFIEWVGVSTMGFPEPMTFGMRARRFLNGLTSRYDILHDNQSLSYGIWALAKRMPMVATIHHPITVDRDLAVNSQKNFLKKIKQLRWYSFIGMQKRVAPAMHRIITMSESGRNDISRVFNISRNTIHVIPNGIDTRRFHPEPQIPREPHRLIVTTSADAPIKGLRHLLKAMAGLREKYPLLHLVVVGSPSEESATQALVDAFGLKERVRFTGRIDQEEYVRQYARAWAAVVPSLYEGFGLPAGEAMACGVPIISSTGGALPELVGRHGLLVPPGDPAALAGAIARLCDHPDLAQKLGRAGYDWVTSRYTWEAAARETVKAYRKAISSFSDLPHLARGRRRRTGL